jgi:hypothetical protein
MVLEVEQSIMHHRDENGELKSDIEKEKLALASRNENQRHPAQERQNTKDQADLGSFSGMSLSQLHMESPRALTMLRTFDFKAKNTVKRGKPKTMRFTLIACPVAT